ncbi:hypothetical protein EYF80_028186 [Liparis tanakae]|uniref:Uncharacterized protein n=1 Tax=Liparis tanakae TaxID=230148 RepID=A0A4Z2H9M4_9TELE|nr:hypothetical protein EYF80_028186 [Liparis tanakae]
MFRKLQAQMGVRGEGDQHTLYELRRSFNGDTDTLACSVWSARRLNDTTLRSINLGRPCDQLAAAPGRPFGVHANWLLLTR